MKGRAQPLGVYVVDTSQLRQINEEAHRNAWGGAWSSGAALSSVVDENGKHVVVPTATASRVNGDDECFRCWLWYLVHGRNERRCTLIDVGETPGVSWTAGPLTAGPLTAGPSTANR